MLIKLLVACRSHDAAVGLCARLAQKADGGLLGEATTWAGVLEHAAVSVPDVLLLAHADENAARTWQTLAGLGRASPATRVLLLCDTCTQSTVIASVRAGASGCLLASSEPSLQVRGVVSVHRGEAWFERGALLEAVRSQMPVPFPVASDLLDEQDHELLTARERQVLGLIGDALSNKEIARRLKISDNTVKTHLHRIYVKLNQSGRYRAFLSSSALRANPLPGRRHRVGCTAD